MSVAESVPMLALSLSKTDTLLPESTTEVGASLTSLTAIDALSVAVEKAVSPPLVAVLTLSPAAPLV